MHKKLWAFLKKDYKHLFYSALWIFTILTLLFLLKTPLDTIQLPTLLGFISGQDMLQRGLTILLGLLTVSTLCLFDFILSRKLQLNVKPIEVFKIAWISHTVGNFMIDIGTKHSGLRYFLYKVQGVGNKKATLMSIMRNTLFVSNADSEEVPLDQVTRYKLIGSLIIRWTIASLFFSYTIGLVYPNSNTIHMIVLFLFAVFLGTLSKVPSGLIIFESICLIGFYKLGYPIETAFAGVLLYRIYYYVIPWLISIFILIGSIATYKNIKLSPQKIRIIHTLGIYALAALMFFTGVFSLATAYSAKFQASSTGCTQLIYMGLGLLTLILSKSIYDKVSSSYFITLGVILVSIVYATIKQFHLLEIVFLLIVGVLIYQSKESFYRKPAPFKVTIFLSRLGLLGILSLSYLWIYTEILEDIGVTPGITLKEPSHLLLFVMLVISSSILLSFIQVQKPSFLAPDTEALEELSQFLTSYEGNSMTHLLFLKDKSLFYAADKKVVIGFRPYRDKLVALGDPIGDPRYFNQAINEFRVYAHQFDMTPLFYEVSDKHLSLYHENGFKFLKLGEEAVVHLKDFTLVGKRGAALRTIKNKMDRGELEFELLTGPLAPSVMNDLRKISDDWLEGRKEKGFSLGFFDEEYINRAPVGIVKKDGVIVGFTTIMPLYSSHTVSIDLMRLIPNPPNGAMDALFIGILLWSIEQGYEKFIVGKAPLSNVGTHKFCSPSEKIAKYIYQYGNRVYSFKGLRRYKEKFYPEWEGSYLAYPKGTNLSGAILNLTRLISGSDDTKG